MKILVMTFRRPGDVCFIQLDAPMLQLHARLNAAFGEPRNDS
jgi:hypothetical protein